MIFGYIDPGTGFTVASLGGILLTFVLGFLGSCLFFSEKYGVSFGGIKFGLLFWPVAFWPSLQDLF